MVTKEEYGEYLNVIKLDEYIPSETNEHNFEKITPPVSTYHGNKTWKRLIAEKLLVYTIPCSGWKK